jgi:protein-S-isoprenylcysteine O-methyltransferase Ste14
MHLKIPPALVAILMLILMVTLSKLFPQFSFSLPYKSLVAIAVAAVGVGIAVAGVASFRRLQTTVNPTRPGTASSLVVDGIYRWSRNPMYLGILLCLIACGIYLANILGLLVIPPVFVIYMNRYQIRPEEEVLALIFGDEFVRYRASARRWL